MHDAETMMHLMQNRGYSPWQNPDAFYHQLPSGRLAVKTMKRLEEYLEVIYKLAQDRMNTSNMDGLDIYYVRQFFKFFFIGENAWKHQIFINTLLSNGSFSKRQIVDELKTIILAVINFLLQFCVEISLHFSGL